MGSLIGLMLYLVIAAVSAVALVIIIAVGVFMGLKLYYKK